MLRLPNAPSVRRGASLRRRRRGTQLGELVHLSYPSLPESLRSLALSVPRQRQGFMFGKVATSCCCTHLTSGCRGWAKARWPGGGSLAHDLLRQLRPHSSQGHVVPSSTLYSKLLARGVHETTLIPPLSQRNSEQSGLLAGFARFGVQANPEHPLPQSQTRNTKLL